MPDLTPDPPAPDHLASRDRFLAEAEAAGFVVESHLHPLPGPEGAALHLDVADSSEAPDTDERPAMVLVSGTHGVEGFAGSALQSTLLRAIRSEPPTAGGSPDGSASAVSALAADDVRLICVHALNPWGLAHVRRVNEDNIDLNRNRVDHDAPPDRTAYDLLAGDLVPGKWDDDTRAETAGRLLERVAEMGLGAFQEAVTGGQFRHPDGLFYGGTELAWSHRILDIALSGRVAASERLAIVDLHTGLGEWGAGEIISGVEPEHPVFTDLVEAYGDQLASPEMGESVSAALTGEWLPVVTNALGTADRVVLPIALEFGTIDGVLVLEALRADAWLHAHGDPAGDDAPAIKAQLRAAFVDDDPAWIDSVWKRTLEVLDMTWRAFDLS